MRLNFGMLRNVSLTLLTLLFCACQTSRQPTSPPSQERLQQAVPPLPAPPLRSKSLVSEGPAKSLSSLKLEWAFAGPVTVERSLDLRAWSTYTNVSASPIFVAANQQAAYFRVLSQRVVTLAWDPSPHPSVNGYKLYAGTASRQYTRTNDVGAATMASMSVQSGSDNYFAATAYNIYGQESDFSAEAFYHAPASTWTAQVPARIAPN